VTQITHGQGGTAKPDLEFDYARDELGLINSVHTAGTANYTLYSYTAVNQIQAFKPGGTFAYDSGDNLIQTPGETLSYDAAGELVAMSGPVAATFTYDARGNRVKSSGALGHTYRYDQANRLVGFDTSAYAYDGWVAYERDRK